MEKSIVWCANFHTALDLMQIVSHLSRENTSCKSENELPSHHKGFFPRLVQELTMQYAPLKHKRVN